MKQLKLLLIGMVGIFSLSTSYAQRVGVGAEISYIRPNPQYEFGFTLKSAPGIAITTRSSNEYRFRWGVSLGYVPFKTTMDVFPTFAYESDGGKDVYYPGEERLKNNRYHFFYGAGIGEFKILETPLSPIIGLDFRINFSSYTLISHFAENPHHAGDNEESFNDISLSLVPKVGVVYDLEDFSFLLTAGYNWDFVPKNKFPYTTVSFSIIYYFE